MIHIALKSEYSFGQCYGFLDKLHNEYSNDGAIGIADFNTFSIYKLRKLCDKSNQKPIFGYRVNVVKDATEKVKPRGQFGIEYVIIAKNVLGLKEIYKLTKINTQNFYYRGNVSITDINNLSKNVIVISTNPITKRLDYIGVNFTTTNKVLGYDFPKVYIDNNYFNESKDRAVYQCYAERNAETKTFPQHILSREEAVFYFGEEAVENTISVADSVTNFHLPMPEYIKFKGSNNFIDDCKSGAKRLGIDLDSEPYKSRFEKETRILIEKDFVDYLLVVAEILNEAKRYCLIGPGRGSSAGSLTCYLLGITTVDPIKFGLIFERFVDINRFDYPDIDSDIPDRARAKVVKQIEKRYGTDNVKTISNVTRLKAKSAIGIFAKGMGIPAFETEELKDNIIDRAAGDARASMCIMDTLVDTEVGKEFMEKYPEMECVQHIEGHAKNKGKHAAGVIICNDNLTEYCGVDERDKTVYLDKKDAEALNLLKVDILGLRTLSVLESCAKLVGFNFSDFYDFPLDDEKAYTVFKEKRLAGVFQFDGAAMASINDSIPMENFDDISACGALGRPGALSSGGTSRYIQLRRGDRETLYYCDKHEKITKSTYGIVIYQEELMFLCREIANMSWADVSALRKAASKTLGDEFFDKYKPKFVEGAVKHSGYDEETATKVWLDISSMGSYSFNKSHSVAYGLISYWCAYAKAHWPLEFIAASLNNSKDDESSLKILREFYQKEGVDYVPVDPDESHLEWAIVDGKLIGGLTNLNGIGPMKAKNILKIRKGEAKLTPAILKKLTYPETPFDILYPVIHHFGKLYKDPYEYGLKNLKMVSSISEGDGEISVIGKLISCDDVDANDYQAIAKRGGEKLDGPTMKVHAKIEDDTGIVMCILGRFKYKEMSQQLLRTKVGDTYFAIVGKVIPGAKIILIDKIANLSVQIGLNNDKEERHNKKYKKMINKLVKTGEHDVIN